MKTVLFLINGIGNNNLVIDNNEIMPNFNKLKKNYLSGVLSSSAINYEEGYRNVSLDINEEYTYSIVKEQLSTGVLKENEKLLEIKDNLEKNNKLQLFCFIDKSPLFVDNLKSILELLNPLRDKKIFLHIVLTSNNNEDYSSIISILNRINIELKGLATIGMILGQDYISNDKQEYDLTFFVKTLISEVGDRWNLYDIKLKKCMELGQLPNSVKPFVVNQGFSLGINDSLMFGNYINIDHTKFINAIKKDNIENNIKFYSLFPITYDGTIPNVFDYQVSNNSLASNLEQLGVKSLIFAKRNQIDIINYYLNGQQNISNPRINYIEIDDYMYKPNELLATINNYDHELIVLNYSIDDFSEEELNNQLHNIDNMLENIYQNAIQNNHNMIISSLYCLNGIVENKSIKCKEVPIIYVNKNINKKDYGLKNSSINDLIKLCYNSIKDSYQVDIITKKSFFDRLFSK